MSIYPPGCSEKDIEKVYQEAFQEIKIDYSKTGGFFDPVLKNINHLEVGSSKIINSRFIWVIESLLVRYENLLKKIKKLNRELYPRDYRIHGKSKNSYITGEITHTKKKDASISLHNMPVQFWARTRFGGWRLFSQGYTNKDGIFKMEFDFLESRRWRYKSFHLEICQISHVYFDKTLSEPQIEYILFERIRIPKGDLTGMGYNVGNLQLFYWEYREDVPIPRVSIKDHDEDSPEYYSEGRNNAIQEQFIPIQVTKDKHLAQISLDPTSISISSIQKDYPRNLTLSMEEKLPYSTRCDYWFGRRMMNGMNCATFLPDPVEENRYWVKYFGACDYEVNDEYAFPTVEIKFRIPPGELPVPEEIITTGPVSQFDKDPFQKFTFTPADGEKWEAAKRVARVSGALSTELDDHFAGTHVNTEQFSIAARRNFRKNPLATLLFPHLKEVALINYAADNLLIGPGYIPQASAITATGIIQRGKDLMGVLDWKNWKPMEVINERHTYAKAENLFWEILSEFVDSFVKDREEEIIREWYEVYRFSEDLVQNSVPVFHSESDFEALSPQAREREKKRIEYYHARFRFDPNLPRVGFNGKKRVISPITQNPTQPEPGDMENLKAACKYAIMQATFMHTWVNEHQYEDIGEVLYSSLGLRFGEHEDGIFRPENDFHISPDLTRSTQMMWFSNLLSRTEYGFITRNEENDINPIFAELLNRKRAEFKELYVEIDNIESRTNI